MSFWQKKTENPEKNGWKLKKHYNHPETMSKHGASVPFHDCQEMEACLPATSFCLRFPNCGSKSKLLKSKKQNGKHQHRAHILSNDSKDIKAFHTCAVKSHTR